jgi:mono/diheme cytochrome c family protein
MSEPLSAAAEVIGAPEAMVQRSAEARAAADGIPVEEVLAAWAGGSTPPAAPEAEAPAVEETIPAPVEEPEPQPEPMQPDQPVAIEAPRPAPEPSILPVRPVPATVGIDGATEWESVTTVPTAGLKERTRTRVPTWLTVAFVILPLAGLLYLLQFAGGPDCGDSGLLAVDRATGEVVNCDGSPFEGRGAPGGGPGDFLARGGELYADAQVACNGCHGNNGEGGVGPAFAGGAVLATFPSCADHVQWIQLGSAGWQAEVGAEYGAQGTLSKGGMPDFGDSLSDEDLRSVALFERVRFGSADLDETLIDCGLVIPQLPAEDEDAPADGDEATESTEASG